MSKKGIKSYSEIENSIKNMNKTLMSLSESLKKLNEQITIEVDNEKIVTTIKTEKTEEKIVEIIEKKQVVEIPKLPVTGM